MLDLRLREFMCNIKNFSFVAEPHYRMDQNEVNKVLSALIDTEKALQGWVTVEGAESIPVEKELVIMEEAGNLVIAKMDKEGKWHSTECARYCNPVAYLIPPKRDPVDDSVFTKDVMNLYTENCVFCGNKSIKHQNDIRVVYEYKTELGVNWEQEVYAGVCEECFPKHIRNRKIKYNRDVMGDLISV